jgi:hypothetical protein
VVQQPVVAELKRFSGKWGLLEASKPHLPMVQNGRFQIMTFAKEFVMPDELKPYFAAIDAAKANCTDAGAAVTAAQAVLDNALAAQKAADGQFEQAKEAVKQAVNALYPSK